MKANELRLNNLVYAFKTVWAIDNSDFSNLDKIETYEFIPLTEEWLLKAGFKHIGDTSHFKCYEFKNSACRFIIDYVYERFFFQFHKHETLSSIRLEYVHELQNLFFSLCGEELVFSSTEP